MVFLFDAANTLIHKPQIFVKTQSVLNDFGIKTDIETLRLKHKNVSEIIIFPDRTSKDFYRQFNSEWLYSLGIVPSEDVLDAIFGACSYLEWESFEDTDVLNELKAPKSVLSNFHGGLDGILDNFFPDTFQELVVSEKEQYRKPDVRFYERAIEQLNVSPHEIIYIGDSVKLDLEPALKTGMRAYLIDRNGDFPYCTHKISSLTELKNII